MSKKTIEGRLIGGLVINGKRFVNFTMREADVGDMIDAEGDVGAGTLIAFNSAMMARQLVSATTDDGKEYGGPFIVDHIRELSGRDYTVLRTAQRDLDAMGEPTSEITPNTTTAS